MLIILYLIMIKVLLPELGIFISVQMNEMMPSVITIIGILALFSVFGITIFAGLVSAVMGLFSRGLGYAGIQFFKGIGFILHTILGWIPKMHKSLKDALRRNGMGEIKAMLLAGVMVFFITLLII